MPTRDESKLQDRTIAGLGGLTNCGDNFPTINMSIFHLGLGAHWEEKVLILACSFFYVRAPIY